MHSSFRLVLVSLLVACDSSSSSLVPDGTSADAPPPAGAFGVNDVSILFPLPAQDAERSRFLWLVPNAGERGPFFPPSAIDQLPDLNADLPRSAGYPSAMITSARFDPCFPRLGGESCQAQLRLVAQPVVTGPSGVSMLDDAAAHLFYALTVAEAEAVIAQLAAIRTSSPVPTTGPLGIHPGFAAEPAGATGNAIRALILDHCREDNLIRITTNSFANDNWGFGKFDRVGDDFVRQPLVAMTTTEPAQAWLRQAFVESLDDPSGTITPAPANGFTYLLSSASFAGGSPVDAGQAASAAARVNAIENPTASSVDDVDCASCHLATQARLFAERNNVTFSGATRYQPPAGQDARLVLAPSLDGNMGATIAFGWHTNRSSGTPVSMPSISQRAVNESAEIAAYLSNR